MLHSGGILPDVFIRGGRITTRLALTPSLPTVSLLPLVTRHLDVRNTDVTNPRLFQYAAVLMESGARTGDAEDNHIAVAPPPAYDNTRGSRLIPAGSSALRFGSNLVLLTRHGENGPV
ncbi:hypothetical protein BDM02DRAFT_2862392 [Thelephora ganbajun]|uniref:Uncharacterized protein n=1 Tax=Thelephora ganbajun TaxID=370292 RepID=A0ACB6ZCN8_THEGA|nr:hypothetical protein BDM02DRAFT_2862392 [Thelephora ganbajun]